SQNAIVRSKAMLRASQSKDFDPVTAVLSTFRDPLTTDFANAWVGMEPTFQTEKSVRSWNKLSCTPKGEDRYFKNGYMPKTEKKVAKAIEKKYRAKQNAADSSCL